MAPEQQQFCLRWNNYQTNLTQVFEQLLQSEKFVDVTLACEGNSLRAHRMVLSSCSTYFQSVLSESPCSHPVIILQGVKWTELKAIVEFMYKGEVNISQDQLSSLLRVGESLKIRGLAEVGGDDSEAVITSPSTSPRVSSQFWNSEEAPRKRRRLSEDRSCSRSRTPSPRVHTPSSAAEILETSVDLHSNLSRGSSVSNPTSLPSPSPVASLASSLSSLAHLHGPMPPPGPPLPPHLAHLPPLSPLSPLLNMHPMPRHHPQDEFEIRPGIAEMIREEERAKLLESTHHWISNPMADSYQAQVQAAWQKSWNQTQSLLQNLRFRERGPLKSWRPETMADAIHAVLREGLSLSQAARKYDIPYPTFVLYANRVHNLLGPSHEPGDLRPKGRGRPQRILLGSWPEDQIKGVIRAVVFRDTAVLRDNNDHKENKHPSTATNTVLVKNETSSENLSAGGAATPNSANATPSRSPNQRTHTPNTAQPSTSGSISNVAINGPSRSGYTAAIKSESPKDASNITQDMMNASVSLSSTSSSHCSIPISNISPNSAQQMSHSRPSSTSSAGFSGNQPNGHSICISPTGSNSSHSKFNGTVTPSGNSPTGSSQVLMKSPNGSPNQLQRNTPITFQSQQPRQHNNQTRPALPHISSPQQLLGLISGGMPAAMARSNPSHMARLFTEGIVAPPPGGRAHSQNTVNTFHPTFPRPGQPGMLQNIGMHPTVVSGRSNSDEQDLSPEAILFGKVGVNERHSFGNPLAEVDIRQNMNNQFDNPTENSSNPMEKQMLYRDALETIKSEPEAIVN